MASSSCDPGEKPLSSSSVGLPGESSEAALTAVEQLKPYKIPVMNKKLKKERICTAKERISKMPPCTAGKRSSIYRGVTRHRWTGRYEAHLWDKTTWNQNQNKKGKQVYLGAYDDEEAAARAYDLAALKYWGTGTIINFPVSDYKRDLEEMKNASREEYLASLRRKSSGFSKCISRHGELGLCDDGEKERIDLTGYIKWWGSSKGVQEKKVGVNEEDEGSESKSCDWTSKPTNPYEMPSLGVPEEHKTRRSGMSAVAILSESVAFNNWKERVKRKIENQNDAVDEKEKEEERCGDGLGIGHVLQRNWYQLAPCFADSDDLANPVIWPPLVTESPTVSSHELDVAKTECASIFSYFQQDK